VAEEKSDSLKRRLRTFNENVGKVKKTPDSPEQARERERQLREFEEEYGKEWVEENRALLDASWEYAKDLDLI
jgi:hypothetical protein